MASDGCRRASGGGILHLMRRTFRLSGFGNRFWLVVSLLLVLLECLPFWILRYFPSQDGPSHLYNASILAHYGEQAAFRQYYAVSFLQLAGNLSTQLLLAGLVKLCGALAAEKVLLSIYAILLFASFYYLLAALTPHAGRFAPLAAIFVVNWFLFMGFWSFLYSVCGLMLIVGYCVRQGNRWTPRSLAILALGGLLLYLTHAVSWAASILAVAILGLPSLGGIGGMRERGRLLRWALPLFALAPPILFLLAYVLKFEAGLLQTGRGAVSLRDRVWPLYSLSFLNTIAASDALVIKALAVSLLAIVLFAVFLSMRQRALRGLPVLWVSAAFSILMIATPNRVGSECCIHSRLALYAWLFLVVWLAHQPWPKWAANTIPALVCCIAIAGAAARFPVLSAWSGRLSAFMTIGRTIPPGSTLLRLGIDRAPSELDPYLHAAGLLAGASLVDLGNYEASAAEFLVRFRPERAPIPALGSVDELERHPPEFDVRRYESQTAGSVDYLLVQGASTSPNVFPEKLLYRDQLAAFQLAAETPDGNLRLYRRVLR